MISNHYYSQCIRTTVQNAPALTGKEQNNCRLAAKKINCATASASDRVHLLHKIPSITYHLANHIRPYSMFLRYVLAFRTRVLKTCVPEPAFWRIFFSNNLWFIKFTHHEASARLPGCSCCWLIIQPSKHDSTLRVYETLDPILTVHFRGVWWL